MQMPSLEKISSIQIVFVSVRKQIEAYGNKNYAEVQSIGTERTQGEALGHLNNLRRFKKEFVLTGLSVGLRIPKLVPKLCTH